MSAFVYQRYIEKPNDLSGMSLSKELQLSGGASFRRQAWLVVEAFFILTATRSCLAQRHPEGNLCLSDVYNRSSHLGEVAVTW